MIKISTPILKVFAIASPIALVQTGKVVGTNEPPRGKTNNVVSEKV